MKTRRRGIVGVASTSVSLRKVFSDKLRAENELHDLGRERRRSSHCHRQNVLHHFNDPYEEVHLLIDYRRDNKVLLRRAMTRKAAWKKNNFLKGTGKAWALVDCSHPS